MTESRQVQRAIGRRLGKDMATRTLGFKPTPVTRDNTAFIRSFWNVRASDKPKHITSPCPYTRAREARG